jgi:chromate transporter
LLELARLFLKLGTTAFGGPAAHIAMMEAEVVRRRQWLTHEEFLDLLGATNLIPGPNSTEMAIHIGHRRAGWRGLLVAGICFILPAALIVTAIACAYVRFGKLPQAEGLLYGIKPVIIAVVVQALWILSRAAVKTKWLALAGLIGVALSFLGVNELIILSGTHHHAQFGSTKFCNAVARYCSDSSAGDDQCCRFIWPVAVVPVLSQSRFGAVRQRLYAAGISARRFSRALALAH